MEKRVATKLVTFWVTQEDYAIITLRAHTQKKNVSDYIRNLIYSDISELVRNQGEGPSSNKGREGPPLFLPQTENQKIERELN